MASRTYNLDDGLNLLANLAERNQGVVLRAARADSAEEDDDGYPVRILKFDDQVLVVDRPSHCSDARVLEPKRAVELVFDRKDHRLVYTTYVLGRDRVTLNATFEVASLMLAPPHRVRHVQRRDYFRMMPPEDAVISLRIRRFDDERNLPMEPSVTTPIGRLGGGGVDVILGKTRLETITETPRVFVSFALPDSGYRVDTPAQIAHLRPLRNGQVRVGIEFLFESGPKSQRTIDEICRQTVNWQRRTLQRQKIRA
ncbi:MAG: hypothetical protein JJU36_12690 [Phycisphaeraceae bacterium]|nr:hypothetical protein [Phycisphaeraceae bacterium]